MQANVASYGSNSHKSRGPGFWRFPPLRSRPGGSRTACTPALCSVRRIPSFRRLWRRCLPALRLHACQAVVTELVHCSAALALVRHNQRYTEPRPNRILESVVVEVEAQWRAGDGVQPHSGPRCTGCQQPGPCQPHLQPLCHCLTNGSPHLR